ncbi:MAG: hypothetical protein AAF572_28465 [Cyanobacteria bacterium P01_B01_bin.77]
MAVFIYFESANTKAQVDIDLNHGGQSMALPQAQETVPVPYPTQNLLPETLAQNYSPVAIILATCALVTAIGKALRPPHS